MSRRGRPRNRTSSRQGTAPGRNRARSSSGLRRPPPTGHGGWIAWLLTVTVLVAVWLMLWGSISPSLVLVGFAAAIVILWLFPLPPMEFEFGLHPVRALVLGARFLLDVVVASGHVVWLSIRPRPPKGSVLEVRLNSDSDLMQHLTALAVSLVPGSLIINADAEQRTLQIHLLDSEQDSVQAVTAAVHAQERRIERALGQSRTAQLPDKDGGDR